MSLCCSSNAMMSCGFVLNKKVRYQMCLCFLKIIGEAENALCTFVLLENKAEFAQHDALTVFDRSVSPDKTPRDQSGDQGNKMVEGFIQGEAGIIRGKIVWQEMTWGTTTCD